MYSNVPAAVKVTRKRVTPGLDCARLARSCGAGDRNPEFTLSEGEPTTACRAPSDVSDTPTDGGRGSAGSVPKVTVWLIDGSRLVHSTVSPTETTTTLFRNRISDAVCAPAPDSVTTAPSPAATPPWDAPSSPARLRSSPRRDPSDTRPAPSATPRPSETLW